MVEDEKFVIVKWVKKEEDGEDINLIDDVLVSLLVKDLNSYLCGYLDDEVYWIK